MLELYLEVGWINYITTALLKAKMIVLFHAICFIFTELSTPVWQKEVRQTTYQVVEAMQEAEETDWVPCSSIFHVTSDRILLFSRFLLLASLRQLLCWKNNFKHVAWAYFLLKSVLVCYFRPKQKNLELSSMFFSTARPRGLGNIWFQSFWEKCHATCRFQNKTLLRTKAISSPLSKILALDWLKNFFSPFFCFFLWCCRELDDVFLCLMKFNKGSVVLMDVINWVSQIVVNVFIVAIVAKVVLFPRT